MYAKYERIHKVWELFDKIHDAKIVSCYAIIIGYAQNRFYKKYHR